MECFLRYKCNHVADAIALHKYLLMIGNSLSAPKAADMNGNGKLNAVDLVLLKRSLMENKMNTRA